MALTLTGDRQSLLRHRQAALTELQELAEKQTTRREEQLRLGDKTSLGQVMKIEDGERQRIARVKKQAGDQVIAELLTGRNSEQCVVDKSRPKVKSQTKERIGEDRVGLDEQAKMPSGQIKSDQRACGDHLLGSKSLVEGIFDKPAELPVRESNKIQVTFTPRVFPTPERESKRQEEDEWLNKQAEHRKVLMERVCKTGELSVAEQDPVWMRNKGNSLFKAGDYEAAVIAYSQAISLDTKMHTAYSNRAACHIQLKNYFRALEDSSTALDLCRPAVAQNLTSRIRAHVRRGVALCNLKLYDQGLVEYKAAHALAPSDESIKADIIELEHFMSRQETVDSNDSS